MRDRELREGSEPLRESVLESVWFVQALCRAVRPLAAGEPVVACGQFVPTVSRAARPSAASGQFVSGEAGYAVSFRGRGAAAGAQHPMERGSMTLVACAAEPVLELAPNLS